MGAVANMEFFLDPNRCIGCQSCVAACSECDTHRGHSMIHLQYVDRPISVQTVPVVCMHCDSPTCAEVCPAGMRPGHFRIAGTRIPPSQTVCLRWNSGALRDSHSPPLSLVKMTIVLSVRPRRATLSRIRPTPLSTASSMAA